MPGLPGLRVRRLQTDLIPEDQRSLFPEVRSEPDTEDSQMKGRRWKCRSMRTGPDKKKERKSDFWRYIIKSECVLRGSREL